MAKFPVMARGVLSVLVLLVAAGCVATSLSDVWQSPGFKRTEFDKVLVVAGTGNKTARIAFEQGFVRHLRERGIHAESSYQVVSREFPKRESIAAYARQAGIRYVVVTRYTGSTEHVEYVPEQTVVTVSGPNYYPYYGWYWDHYGQVSVRHNEAYTDTRRDVMLMTAIYRLEDEALVWGARSKTFEPGAVSFSADELAGKVVSHIDRF